MANGSVTCHRQESVVGTRMCFAIGAIVINLQEEGALVAPHIVEHVGHKVSGDGDKSDNLKGVPGAGLATIAKRLPFLKEEKDCTIDDVFSYSEKHRDEFKFYSNLVDNKKLVKTNYKIMQLYSPIISLHTVKKVNNTISNSKMMLNRTGVVKMMIEDGFGEGNWDDLFRHMKKIVISNK